MMDQYRTAIRYGLIWAVIAIITTLILYLLGMMENVAAGILLFLMGIYMMYRSGVDRRAELGNAISWKQALTPTWLTSIIAVFISSIFTWILYAFIDPSLQEKQKEKAIEMIEKMRGWMGDAEAEKQLAELENKDFSGFGMYMQYFLIAILFYFIVACILSLIIRKKKDEDVFTKYPENS